jgi:hypothetical protein
VKRPPTPAQQAAQRKGAKASPWRWMRVGGEKIDYSSLPSPTGKTYKRWGKE